MRLLLILALSCFLARAPHQPGQVGEAEDLATLVLKGEKASGSGEAARLARQALASPGLDEPGREGWKARALALVGKRKQAQGFFLKAAGGKGMEGGLVRSFYRNCLELDREGSMELCLAGFEALRKALPDQVWTYSCLAVALRHACRYQESDSMLARAVPLAPRDPLIPNDRALVWKAVGKTGKAVEFFRRAAELDKEGRAFFVRVNLGLLLADLGRLAEAGEWLEPVPGREPGLLAGLLWLRHSLCKNSRLL